MINKYIQKIDFLLREANFDTFLLDFGNKKNKYCFDLLVKKKDTNLIFLVKVFLNIDNLNEFAVNSIKALSTLLKSRPLLIGIKNRYQKLEDNTIYIREDLPFITINTLENISKHKIYPHILAKRGGGVVFLDGNHLKILREQKNISRKELAEALEVAKRTVCAYEKERIHPSEPIAQKIVDLLGDDSLFRKINVFKWNFKFDMDQKEVYEDDDLNPFETHLQDIFEDIGISTFWHKNGQVPFKLSLYSDPSKLNESTFYPLFSAVSDQYNKINDLNLKYFITFTKLLHKQALFIVNDNLKIPDPSLKKNISIMEVKKLEKIDNEDEFIEFIQGSGKK